MLEVLLTQVSLVPLEDQVRPADLDFLLIQEVLFHQGCLVVRLVPQVDQLVLVDQGHPEGLVDLVLHLVPLGQAYQMVLGDQEVQVVLQLE